MKTLIFIFIVCIIGFLIAWRLIWLAAKYDEQIEEIYKKYFEKENQK